MSGTFQEKAAVFGDSRVHYIAENMYRTYKNRPNVELVDNPDYPHYWFKEMHTYIVNMISAVDIADKNKYITILFEFAIEYRNIIAHPSFTNYKDALIRKANQLINNSHITAECKSAISKFLELI